MSIFGTESIYWNMTEIVELLGLASILSSGVLGIAILLMISFGAFFIMSTFNYRDALLGATFVSLMTSLFLWYLNLIEPYIALFSLVAFVIALIVAQTGKGKMLGA